MKINWDKVLWSEHMMVINAACFAFMLYVFAEGCRETNYKNSNARQSNVKKK